MGENYFDQGRQAGLRQLDEANRLLRAELTQIDVFIAALLRHRETLTRHNFSAFRKDRVLIVCCPDVDGREMYATVRWRDAIGFHGWQDNGHQEWSNDPEEAVNKLLFHAGKGTMYGNSDDVFEPATGLKVL